MLGHSRSKWYLLCLVALVFMMMLINLTNLAKPVVPYVDYGARIYQEVAQPKAWLANYKRSGCSYRNPHCFDLARCCNFSLYVYEPPSTNIWQDGISALRESPFRTLDPNEACLLFPDLEEFECNALPSGQLRCFDRDLVSQILRQLPYWNEGKNHVVLDYRDWYWSKHGRDWAAYDIDQAVSLKSSCPDYGYRQGYDIALAIPRQTFPTAIRHAVDRPYYAYFRGSAQVEVYGTIRRDVVALHDVARGWICVDSNAESGEAEQYPFDTLAQAKFGLVPRGYGLHTYRLFESLAAGAVPVILADHLVLPFEDLLDWDSFSVRVAEADVTRLPQILAKISPTRWLFMQQTGNRVYEMFFSSQRQTMERVIDVLRERLDVAVRESGVCS